MKNITAFSLSMVLLMAFYQNAAAQSSKQSVKSSMSTEATIQRVVCFKFKPGTTPEAIQQHLEGLAALKDSIPYILSYQAGSTVQGELKEKSEYDVMHYFTFRSEADIPLYYNHPAHLRFAQKNSKNWEKFFVVNAQLRP
jgi:hypothetical protein